MNIGLLIAPFLFLILMNGVQMKGIAKVEKKMNEEYHAGPKGGLCNDESDVIRSESDCKKALEALGYGPLLEFWITTKDQIPAGCSIHAASSRPHLLTTSGMGQGREDLTPICKGKDEFVLGNRGASICSDGEVIMDQSTCKTACDKLDIPPKEILGNYGCYKDGEGNCYQNGKNGGGASMICKKTNDKNNDKNIESNGHQFLVGEIGAKNCQDGDLIRDKLTCQKACKKLKLPEKEMIDALFQCYKDKQGNCNHNSYEIPVGASLICKTTNKNFEKPKVNDQNCKWEGTAPFCGTGCDPGWHDTGIVCPKDQDYMNGQYCGGLCISGGHSWCCKIE